MRGEQYISVSKIFHFHALEKEMATHSRNLAWRIPGTGLPSVGSHRVRHEWSDLAAAAAAASSWNSQNKKHFLNPSVIYFQLSSSQTKMVSYFFLSILSSFSFAHWFFSHIEIHCKTYRKFNKLQVRLIQRPISRHVIIKLSKNKKNL